jgi:hypothetical protein
VEWGSIYHSVLFGKSNEQQKTNNAVVEVCPTVFSLPNRKFRVGGGAVEWFNGGKISVWRQSNLMDHERGEIFLVWNSNYRDSYLGFRL